MKASRYQFVFEVEDWGSVSNAVFITNYLYKNPFESATNIPLDGGGYVRAGDSDATGQKGRFAFHLAKEGQGSGPIIPASLLEGIARDVYARMQI